MLRLVLKAQLGPQDPGMEVPGARDPPTCQGSWRTGLAKASRRGRTGQRMLVLKGASPWRFSFQEDE